MWPQTDTSALCRVMKGIRDMFSGGTCEVNEFRLFCKLGTSKAAAARLAMTAHAKVWYVHGWRQCKRHRGFYSLDHDDAKK